MGIPIPVEPTLDERTATAAANKAEKAFADAGKKAGQSFSDGITGGTQAAEESLRKFGNRAKDTYDKATDAVGRLRAEEAKLQDLRDRGARNDQLVAQVERTEKARRAEARAIREATDALGDYERARDSAERGGADAGVSLLAGMRGAAGGAGQTGQDMANDLAHGFAASSMLMRLGAAGGPIGLALAGVATLGVAAGKQLADGLAEGMQQLQVQDVFRTRMGVDADTMNRFGSAAGKAWTNGFGMSSEANLSTIDVGFQARLLDRSASEDQVQKFVERMDTVARVTGESQQSLALGARGLVSGGMVGNYTDAFDLIIAAQEKGLNLTGDMMDTLNEYAINFKNLGLSGAEALGLIDQMYASNIRNSDLAADSLREFSISANDRSDSTKAAFRALGFSADDMGRRFAEGGEQAKTAFGAVMVALAGIEDPQERTNIGLALFKTRWEEANTAIMAMDLKAAGDGFTNISGKVDAASKNLQDHANGWTNLGNTISNEIDKIKQKLADSDFGKWFMQDLPDAMKTAFTSDPPGPPKLIGPGILRPGVPASALPGLSTPGLFSVGPHGAPGAHHPAVDLSAPAAPSDNGPVPGAPMPFDTAAAVGKAKPSFDPSQYSVDAIPVVGALGAPGVPGGVSQVQNGQIQWGTGGDPYGKPGYGYYQVDPQRVYDAESSQMSARNSVEQARIRVLELEADNTTTAQELAAAKNAVTMAERGYLSTQTKLAEAQQGTWKKLENTAKQFGQGMEQIGAALDNDLGISKGLPGLAENLTKFIANLAAAPLLGQLNAISAVNPSKGGYGLMGILASQGAFGSRWTGVDPNQSGYGYAPGIPQNIGMPSILNDTGSVPSGPQSRYAAALVQQLWGNQIHGQIGGSRNDNTAKGTHDAGLSIDIPIGPDQMALGDQINAYLQANANALGIEYTIWRDQGKYPGGGGFTTPGHQNHIDAHFNGNAMPYSSNNVATPAGDFSGFGAPGSKQAIANMIFQQATQRGYNPHEAQSIVAYAIGESGLNPGISGGVQGDAEVIGLFQQKPAFARAGGIDPSQRSDPAYNTYAYLNQLDQHRNLPIEQALPATSVGGPLASGPGAQPQNWDNLMNQAADLLGYTTSGPAVGSPGVSAGPSYAYSSTPAPLPTMAGGPVRNGAPQAAPFALSSPVGGVAFPSQPGGGFQGVQGAPLDAAMGAAAGLDLLAPGAGQAAQMGVKLANRAIGYAGQLAGIGVSGLMETFLPSSSPLGNIGNSWFGKLASGFAGARPALPNVAGQQAPPNPNPQGQGDGQADNSRTMNFEYHSHNEGKDDSSIAKDAARHAEAQNSFWQR